MPLKKIVELYYLLVQFENHSSKLNPLIFLHLKEEGESVAHSTLRRDLKNSNPFLGKFYVQKNYSLLFYGTFLYFKHLVSKY